MSDTSLPVAAALALVDALDLGGGLTLLPDDPAAPPKPSPIDPVIRDALYWIPAWISQLSPPGIAAGPVPEPWLPAAIVPPAPAPLPARIAAALVERAGLVADASGPEAAASYVQRMVDDLCPPPRVIPIGPPKGSWPPSEPRPILGLTISPGDLLRFAASLRSAARRVPDERLAGAIEAGAVQAATQAVGEIAELRNRE